MTGNGPSVSVIVNTDGRAESLRRTLDSLRYLRFPGFEVVVVAGPTADGTGDLLAAWNGAIKLGHCPARNLAQSRNIGIGLAAGAIVAFIDDDAVAEPEWLADLVPAFADPRVGSAGGFVYNHTGREFQWRFGTSDRFAATNEAWHRAAPEFNFPLSFNFPALLGTNSLFRRRALVEIGGFDEEFEYYLDETDAVCRLVDRGWRIAQLDRGFVHHQYLPSPLRDRRRMLTGWYPVIKNKVYFSLVNGALHLMRDEAVASAGDFIAGFRAEVDAGVRAGWLPPEDRDRFEREADQALADGIARGSAGVRRLPGPRRLAEPPRLLPFPPLLPAAGPRCLVLVDEAGPEADASPVRLLSLAVAAAGHQVHLLTGGDDDRTGFADGVWVHCRAIRRRPAAADAAAMLHEAHEIAARRPVAGVYAPVWNAEAAALSRDGSFPLVIGFGSLRDREPAAPVDIGSRQAVAAALLPADPDLAPLYAGLLECCCDLFGRVPPHAAVLSRDPRRLALFGRRRADRDCGEFLDFLAAIDRDIPSGRPVRTIFADRGLADDRRVRAWFSRHRRFTPQIVPRAEPSIG